MLFGGDTESGSSKMWNANSGPSPVAPIVAALILAAIVAAFVFAGGPQRIDGAYRSYRFAQCNHEASATNAVSPVYPTSAMRLHLPSSSVLVQLTIDPLGTIRNPSVQKSSGNAAIDSAAMRAATASTYSPKVINCRATSATYLFRADFSND